jgi:hypothetical protein
MSLTINSDTSLQQAIGELREAYKAHKFIRLTLKTGKARTLDQNGISHVWYEQIARELREDTPLEVKNFCKLNYGVPILRAEDKAFRKHYDMVFLRLSYEQKLEAMTHLPVTSLMNKSQLNQYLAAMVLAYANRVKLEFPEQEMAA